MSNKDDISATEQLLRLIRQDSGGAGPSSDPEEEKKANSTSLANLSALTLENDAHESKPPSPAAIIDDILPALTYEIPPDPNELVAKPSPSLTLERGLFHEDSPAPVTEQSPPLFPAPEGLETAEDIPVLGEGGSFPLPPAQSPSMLGKVKQFIKRGFSLSRVAGTTAGIAFYSDCFAVLVLRPARGRVEICGFRVQPYRETEAYGLLPLSEMLKTPWLKQQVAETCNQLWGAQKIPLWCLIANGDSEIHQVSLPKAAEKNIGNAIVWAAKQQIGYDEDKNVFDYVYLREYKEKDAPKLMNLVFLGSRDIIEALKSFFAELHYPLTGITTTSSALQNIFQQELTGPLTGTFSNLQIDEDRSIIDFFMDGALIFSREINTGIASFTEHLMEMALNQGIILDEHTAKELAFHASPGTLANHPAYKELIIKKQGSINYAMPATGRLVRQLQRTFNFCTTTFNLPREEKIFVTGLPAMSVPFLQYMQKELDLPVEALDPFAPECMLLAPAQPAPLPKDRTRLLFPLGAALAAAATSQNFLFTSKEKEQADTVRKTNKIIAIACLAILLCLGGASFWLFKDVARQERIHKDISEEYRRLNPLGNNDLIKTNLTVKASRIKKLEEDNLAIASRFLHVALLHDISQRFPDEAKITRLDLVTEQNIQKNDSDKKDASKPDTGKTGKTLSITVEGYVAGRREQQEFILADLLQGLAESPLLGEEVTIKEKKEVNVLDRDVLQFKIVVKPHLLVPTAAAPPAAPTVPAVGTAKAGEKRK